MLGGGGGPFVGADDGENRGTRLQEARQEVNGRGFGMFASDRDHVRARKAAQESLVQRGRLW